MAEFCGRYETAGNGIHARVASALTMCMNYYGVKELKITRDDNGKVQVLPPQIIAMLCTGIGPKVPICVEATVKDVENFGKDIATILKGDNEAVAVANKYRLAKTS